MEAFEGIVGKIVSTVAFCVLKDKIQNYKGTAIRLVDYYDASRAEKETAYFYDKNKYQYHQDKFMVIPGTPIAYWISENVASIFEEKDKVGNHAVIFEGLKTRDNDRFLRLWFEVCSQKWKPYAKGGAFRRWYGNRDYVVNWGESGDEVRSFKKSSGANFQYFFLPTLTYTALTNYKPDVFKKQEIDAVGPLP